MNFVKIPYPDGAFEMMETPVTQGQWKEVMGSNPSRFEGKNNPVEMVLWNEAKEFIQKLNESQKEFTYRLPIEKEFEFAMGKDPDESELKDYAWYVENSKNKMHPVKKKPNEFGLYDIRGNVWEMTDTNYNSSEYDWKIIKGGSWDNGARNLRSAVRGNVDPGFRGYDVGFRPVRTVSLGPLTLSSSKSESAKRDEAIALLKRAIELLEKK